MARSLANLHPAGHLTSLEHVRPQMAKADLKKVETDVKLLIGRAIARARQMVGWSAKELSGRVGVDQPTLSRWEAGTERPHFDRLMAIDELHEPLIVCLAGLDDEAEVVTEIRFRRRA
jgi:ribosome-binding protein aMBF1 (putative translation factor)